MRRQVTQRELDAEDLQQTIGLARAKAACAFDPMAGMPWCDYLDQTIRNEVRAMTRAKKRSRPRRGQLIRLEDLRSEPEAPPVMFGAPILLAETIEMCLRSMSPVERDAMRSIIAEELGIEASHTTRWARVRARATARRVVPSR